MTSAYRCLELAVQQDAEAEPGQCRKIVADIVELLQRNGLQAAFRDRKAIDGYVPCEKNLAVEIRIGNRMVGAEIAGNQLEALRRQIIADLFMHFANNALQKTLVAFA